MCIKIEQTLWEAYQDVYFTVDNALNIKEFCVITAWNPGSVILSDHENKVANLALENELIKQNYAKILVGNHDRSWIEESFAVELSRLDSTKLAKKYRQNAIYYVQNDQIYLIPCVDCGRSEAQIGRFSQRMVDQ